MDENFSKKSRKQTKKENMSMSDASNHSPIDRLMTVRDLAAYLQLSPSTIYHMIGRDELPYIKWNRQIRFSQNAIDAELQKRLVMRRQ